MEYVVTASIHAEVQYTITANNEEQAIHEAKRLGILDDLEDAISEQEPTIKAEPF
jgi:hypothetical protein